MTLDLYPLVYLPVAAALRRTDPALEESARALGLRPLGDLPAGDASRRSAPALIGGMLVVSLALLAEFGAFEIVDFQTFTTEIFTELNVDQSAAAALALLLVALGIVVLLGRGDRLGQPPGQPQRPAGVAPARPAPRSGCGRRRPCSGWPLLVGPGARRARSARWSTG